MFKNYGYDNLGFLELSFSYLSLAFGCLIANPVIERIGIKNAMISGSICDSIWIVSQMVTTMNVSDMRWIVFVLNTFGAFISGIASAFLWIASGTYIARCATHDTKGFYYGYFWSMCTCSQIIGNYISA